MKAILLALTLVGSLTAAAAPDDFSGTNPASLVQDTLNRGQQILADKSTTARVQGLCSLLQSRLDSSGIGYSWLGDYTKLTREHGAVTKFYAFVPTIILNKILSALGSNADGASFTVDPNYTDDGNGAFEVGVTLNLSNGNSYDVTAMLDTTADGLRLNDITYMGFSGVGYVGQDYKNILDNAYNADPVHSMPVEALMKNISSQAGFVNCP